MHPSLHILGLHLNQMHSLKGSLSEIFKVMTKEF